ncbi:MAG: PEP/pyruvate-binding domain-containing protein [Candidatus Odinarchaeota archaeon]
MKPWFFTFKDLPVEKQVLAGGKGGVLARLFQSGYNVPYGLVILPHAFDGDTLNSQAWVEIQKHLAKLRKASHDISFAVRSSALAEDSATASFGGQFETVLGVSNDKEIHDAIHRVRRSRLNERVKAYSEAKGLDTEHEIAVVIQQLVRSDISGVLFTADPVTGRRSIMTGNFIHGYGEKLVSGEATPQEFTLAKPKGQYNGSPELKKHAKQLYKLGKKLEEDLGSPQDIEWTIANNKLYLLQSRPITTLIGHDLSTGEWNDSLTGDYLWASHLMVDIFPDIVTTSTWSLLTNFYREVESGGKLPGFEKTGLIAGRPYLNVSGVYSVMKKITGDKKARDYLESMIGEFPDIEIPIVPVTAKQLLFDFIPGELKWERKKGKYRKNLQTFLETLPERCQNLMQKIQETSGKRELIVIWQDEVIPLFNEGMLTQIALNEDYLGPHLSLSSELKKLPGEEPKRLLTTIGGNSDQLESIGPLIGLAKILKGEMSYEDYLHEYGHRSSNENELSDPRPIEIEGWLDKQLEKHKKSAIDIDDLFKKGREDFDDAWSKFHTRFPKKAKKIKKTIDDITETTRVREEIRSALSRIQFAVRVFFLRTGELTGLGEDIFFITVDELLSILSGNTVSREIIANRKATYEQYKSLPVYPPFIRGRFDPFKWAADPDRRYDLFDPLAPVSTVDQPDTIKGQAGSDGRVEGVVRVVKTLDEGEQLQAGEILVTSTTNVGWTPLFPRAAAIITDIGGRLAHASIIARELGIPAVVGCNDATTRLKTGDRVLVDGMNGIIKILAAA